MDNYQECVIMEKMDIYLYEPEFYNHNLKKFIVILIQISLSLYYIIASLFTFSWILFIINITNWVYLNYLCCMRFQMKLTCKIGLFKEQCLLGLTLLLESGDQLPQQVPTFLIFNMLYFHFNWASLYKSMSNSTEGLMMGLISVELILQIFKEESLFKFVSNIQEYLSRMYFVVSLILILICLKYLLLQMLSKVLCKIEQLNAIIQKKDLYQASMIHELRNPLHSIIGGIDLLISNENIQPEDEKTLKIALHSAVIMNNLIGSILDLAKLDANKMDLDPQYVLLRQNLSNVMDIVEFKSRDKKIKLLFHFAHDVPDYIFIDHQRLTQILLNIVSNAVKFTEKGYVKVLVYFIPGDENPYPRNNVYLKRNSAPDYMMFESNNTLLQVTSHDTEDFFDYGEVSKRFKEISIKRSLLHISPSLLFDQYYQQRRQPEKKKSTPNSKQLFMQDSRFQEVTSNFNILLENNSQSYNVKYNRAESKDEVSRNSLFNRNRSIRGEMLDSKEENKGSRDNSQKSFRLNVPVETNEEFKKETVYTDDIEEDFQIDLKSVHEPKEAYHMLKNQLYGQVIQFEDPENLSHSEVFQVPASEERQPSWNKFKNSNLIRSVSEDQKKNNSSNNNNNSAINSHDFYQFRSKKEELKNIEMDFLRADKITPKQNINIYQDQNSSSIMQINKNEESKNEEYGLPHIIPSQRIINLVSISPSNQQDGHSFTQAVAEQSEARNQQFQIPAHDVRLQNMSSLNQNLDNPGSRSKSDNRLEQFRKQRNFLRVNTRVTDQQQLAQNKKRAFYENPSSSGHDNIFGHSPMPQRNIPSNAPSIISDPNIINDRTTSGYLQIVIQDSGIGMTEEEQKKLFSPFQQANKSIQRKYGGTGLGLWISQRLIKQMKGKINMRSVKEKGTTFTLKIPTKGVSFEELNVDKQLRLECNLSRLHILILIQDELNKEIVRKFLIKLRCQISFANDFDDFNDKLEFIPRFNVCIIDIDGFSRTSQTMVKELIKLKKDIEMKNKKALTLLLLSNMDIDQRQRTKYFSERVIIFKKPVKQNALCHCLSQISGREKPLLPQLLQKEQHKYMSMRLRKSENTLAQFREQTSIQKQNLTLEQPIDAPNTVRIQQKNFEPQINQMILEESKSGAEMSQPEFHQISKNRKSLVIANTQKWNMQEWAQPISGRLLTQNILENLQSVQTPVFERKKASNQSDFERAKEESKKMKFLSSSNNILLEEESKMSKKQSQTKLNPKFEINVEQLEKDQNEGRNAMIQNLLLKVNKQNTNSNLLLNSDKQNQINYYTQKIMVVDDESINRNLIYETLHSFPIIKNNRYEVVQACNGLEALELYKQDTNIILIFTDLEMPVMDGFESVQKIREFEKLLQIKNEVRIIGVSGQDMDHRFRKQNSYENTGIHDFIQKPVRRDALEKVLFDLLI